MLRALVYLLHMKTYLTPDFFTQNRRRLSEVVDEPLIVVTAHGLLQKAGDNTYPFHQDSNFWYLTGVNEPDLILVLTRTDEYLIVPGRSASREAFDGSIDPTTLSNRSGIAKIVDSDRGWREIAIDLEKYRRVATPAAATEYVDAYGMYTNPARSALTRKLLETQHDVELVDCRAQLAQLRVIKQPVELVALQEAIDITTASISALITSDQLSQYSHEYEFEADLTREFRYRGATGHAFAPIVASGQRACTLHNVANEGLLEPSTLLVVDVGAEVDHYAADITRTVAVGGPSARQQAVYDAVLEVQDYALSLLQPGILLKDYEKQVETRMGQALHELGLISEPSSEQIRTYFPHATSHFLGLDVHDVGPYDIPLAENMVITCEPGIYIPKEGIGVRIEDDVLITSNGAVVLSNKLSKNM